MEKSWVRNILIPPKLKGRAKSLHFKRVSANGFFSLSLLFILVSTYKLGRSQFSLSTNVYHISIFIFFKNLLNLS